MSKRNNDTYIWQSFFRKWYWLFVRGAPSKRKAIKELAALDLNSDSTILELGCGTGFFLRRLKREGFRRLTGLDFVPEFLDRIKQSGSATILSSIEDFSVLSEDRYDLVFSDGVFEHFPDPSEKLRKGALLSRDYFVTMVPRPTLSNLIQTTILKPPTEYNKTTEEWVSLHRSIGFSSVSYKVLGMNNLMVICRW